MTGPPLVLGPMERILHLRLLPALESLPPKVLGAIAHHADEHFFAAGELLVDPASAPDAVFVIVDGRVEVERESGRPFIVQAGGTVGFFELLARTERGITARALNNTLTIELGWDAQLEVCEQYFSVLHAYERFIARHLVSLMKRSERPFGLSRQGRGTGLIPEYPLDLVDRVMALCEVDAFAATSMDAIVELARHVYEVRYEQAHTLWRRGEDAQEFVLITGGVVRCSRRLDHQWEASPRIALGMHEALAGRTRWYDAVSTTPVKGLRIDIEPFLDMLEDHFELAMDVMARMAANVIQLSNHQREQNVEEGAG